MGIVFRQSIKSTIVTFSGALLGAGFNYLSAIILSKQLLGINRNLINTGAVLQMFTLAGTAALLQTFVRKYPGDPRKRAGLFTLCIGVPAIITLLLLLPYFGMKSRIIGLYQPEDRQMLDSYYHWLPVLTLLFGYMTLLESFLIAHLKIAIAALGREVLLRLVNLAALLLYYYGLISFDGLIACTALGYGLPVLLMLYSATRVERSLFANPWAVFDRSERRELGKFAAFHLLTGVSVTVTGYLDSLMLAPLDSGGMNALAVYSIAVFIVSFIMIPFRAMASSSFTAINEAYISKDTERLHGLYHRVSVNIIVPTVWIILVILANMGNLIRLLPAGYEALQPLVGILVIGRLVDVATGMNNDLIGVSRYYRMGFYASLVLMLLILLLNRLLIPRYGFYGAAWSATSALCIINTVKMYYLYRKMGITPFARRTPHVVAGGAAILALSFLVPLNAHPILDGILRSLVLSIAYAALVVWARPSEDLSLFISNLRKRIASR